jgi:hypothetical protein
MAKGCLLITRNIIIFFVISDLANITEEKLAISGKFYSRKL